MSLTRKIVFLLAAVVLGLSFTVHAARAITDAEGIARFSLCCIFAALVLLQYKHQPGSGPVPETFTPRNRPPLMRLGLAATALIVCGVTLKSPAVEWTGILVLAHTAFCFSLNPHRARNASFAMLALWPLVSPMDTEWCNLVRELDAGAAEWLLHALNIPAWANGTAVTTGTVSVETSAMPGGGITAVLAAALGASILFRLKWYRFAGLAIAGILQAAILNTARLLLALRALSIDPTGSINLARSDGPFVAGVTMLVVVEALAVRLGIQARTAQTSTDVQGNRKLREAGLNHPFWLQLNRLKWGLLSCALVAALLVVAVRKRTPGHRAKMIGQTIEGLIATDPDNAVQAAEQMLALVSGDTAALGLLAEALIARGRNVEALTAIQQIPSEEHTSRIELLKAHALVALGQKDRALATLDALPARTRNRRETRLLAAELAAAMGKVHQTVDHVLYLVESKMDFAAIERIRNLFPFLASREQWPTIAACHRSTGDQDGDHALLAAQADYWSGRLADAGAIVQRLREQANPDPHLLNLEFALVLADPTGPWSRVLERDLRALLPIVTREHAMQLVPGCFALHRPDLAWMIWYRLESLDPDDPALPLIAARFGEQWFTFRRHHVGLPAQDSDAVVDLRVLLGSPDRLSPELAGLLEQRALVRTAPLLEKMAMGPTPSEQVRLVRQCLDMLEKHGNRAAESWENELVDVEAHVLAGDYDTAHAKLGRLESIYPSHRADSLLKSAVLYYRESEPGLTYECARTHASYTDYSHPLVSLLYADSMIDLGLGTFAPVILERAVNDLPLVEYGLAPAVIRSLYGLTEEALNSIELDKDYNVSEAALVELLRDTGRFVEAKKHARDAGIDSRLDKRNVKQALSLPPAEQVIALPLTRPLSPEQMESAAAKAEAASTAATSAFISGLESMCARWYRAGGTEQVSQPAAWMLVGRDNIEKAAALTRLSFLLANEQMFGQADAALARACELVPESAELWRIRIALTEGATNVVASARSACPDDSTIWLASLVATDRDLTSIYSPQTLVRAGDLMLRRGKTNSACLFARSAITRAPGLLPAHLLGLKCAIRTKDFHWALECEKGATDSALDPCLLDEVVKNIKSPGRDIEQAECPGLPIDRLYLNHRTTFAALGDLSQYIEAELERQQIRDLLHL